ncbi:MAG: peroxide stress protein YaaA [Campylobacterota bacterium]|nr:peroxide stress protein YaaA [Campylobacterota bacterium]
MKILFSPSEAKHRGGNSAVFDKDSFLFPELFEKRLETITQYNDYMSQASHEEKMKTVGTKKQNIVEYYSDDIFQRDTMKAIDRYDGVAYDYLDYPSLDKNSQEYIDKNTIIFSNLFGPLLAGDTGLPDYKLKQGEKIDGFAPEEFYRRYFSSSLDELLRDRPLLDLRAGFYNKFYKPSTPYTTLKFIKNGKVVSHWAKAYRGVVLRTLAQNNIQDIEEFMSMEIDTLMVREILNRGVHREIVYEISDLII